MPRAYSYIRFSTPEQARGDSLRRQLAAAEAWCAERGLTLDDTLRDLGVSAYHGANRTTGALKSFLDLVESGQVKEGSYLIVESLDRLSREAVIDAASRLLDLIRAGITVVTLSDGQEYSADRLRGDWTPLVISLAVMARAHDESRMKSERVGAAWAKKKAAAREERRPLTPRCPEWLDLKDGRFVERPERVALVRRIFRETIDGAGRREIVRHLNAEGVPAFRGSRGWHTSSVAKVVQSRAVLGEYQPHRGTHRGRNRKPDGDPIPDFYPAIVDEATFWRAQAATQGRRQRSAGRKGNAVHLLQGLARCASCGGAMHVRNHGKPPKGGIYLVCDAHARQAGCDNARRWRVDRLEPALLTALGYVEAEAFAPLDDATPAAAERVTAARAKLADAEARRERLLALAETGDDAAAERFKAIAAEVRSFRRDLKTAEAEAAKLAADPGLVARLTDAATLSRQIEDPDVERRRALRVRLSGVLRGLVERVECRAEHGAIMVLKPHLGPRHIGDEDSDDIDGPPVPFALRVESGVWSMLLEPDADDAAVEAFLGWPASDWEGEDTSDEG